MHYQLPYRMHECMCTQIIYRFFFAGEKNMSIFFFFNLGQCQLWDAGEDTGLACSLGTNEFSLTYQWHLFLFLYLTEICTYT